MVSPTPTLTPAIVAVREYAKAHESELTPQQVQILTEVARRLERLQIQAAELIEINNRLWEKEGFKVDFDPDRDTVTVSFGGIEHQLTLKRADPNVPMKMRHLSSTSAYDAGAAEPADDEEQMLRVELEEKVESYYQSANLVLKLLGRFPGMAKVGCQPISRVRNNLIEHAHEAGAYVYSFGVGSTGPRVKPSYQGKQVFNDDGLVPNTEAFVEAVVFGCRGIES